jgi:hypothetical protein
MKHWAASGCRLAGFLHGELEDVDLELPCACIDVLDSDEDKSVPERFSNLDVVMAIKQEVKFAIGRCGYILRTAKSGDQHSVRCAHTYAYMEACDVSTQCAMCIYPDLLLLPCRIDKNTSANAPVHAGHFFLCSSRGKSLNRRPC